LCALAAPSSWAQSGKGAISGHITDTGGGILQGATITVDPRGISAVSDAQGSFLVNGLADGSYTVTISYVGFTNSTKTVTVSGGQVANADAKLSVSAQSLEVLVTAERPSGEAEEVNRERSAENVVQVLTSDVIRSLPNANMADALGRLPSVTIERDEGEGKYVQVRGTEPRLTNLSIDGILTPSPEAGIRQIKLDTIPADIVESVEINKTLQANMDPDGIGGSVNLVTKVAGERPTVNVSGMGGYTSILGGRGVVETTGTVGQRFGANKKFGLLIGGSYDWNGRGIDDIEPVPDIATFRDGTQARYFDSIDIREYRYYRSRWGLAGSADYKLGEGSNIYIRGLYSDFHNYGDRWVYTLNDNTPNVSLATVNAGINSTGCPVGSDGFTMPPTAAAPCTAVPSLNVQLRRPDYAIGSVVLGGKHVLSTSWYAWDLSAARARQVGQVGDQNANFGANNLSSSSCQFDPAAATRFYIPKWTQSCYTEAYTPSNFTLNDVQTNHGLTAQLNLQAAGALAKRYHLGSHLSTIEIGGKFRNAHKFDNTFRDTMTPTGTISLADPALPSKFSNSDYYTGNYKLGPDPLYRDVLALLNSSGFSKTSTAGGNSNNFDLIEKVSAGYVMNTLDLTSRFRLVAGVRFEGTNLDTSTFLTTTDASGNTTSGFVRANGSYVAVLPSASLRFALNSNTNLRLVYSRGLSRPDPQDIAQARTFDNTANPIAVSLGNPGLKAEKADNVDVLVEHYINPFGIISAGYFYKNLTDPIVTETFKSPSGTFFGQSCTASASGCSISQPINAGSAWINGFEAAYLQHLTFLPGMLQGLGISANYGYTASRASGLPGRSDHPRLIRNAPHTWNVSPTYDRGRVSVRVGLSYNAANINAYQFQDGTGGSSPSPGGIGGPFSDDYFFAHLQVDAQGSIRMTHGLSFIMYGLNLTNEVFGFYFGSPQYFHQREFYQPTVAAGFRWSPTHEK